MLNYIQLYTLATILKEQKFNQIAIENILLLLQKELLKDKEEERVYKAVNAVFSIK